ncbi:unnamed protein product [Prunus armeniaca]|uniref:Uncharacterized protein n=1 Tax=Prunus armeniaca TaxID=36596 RepID=A0A6J5TL19_PRUAR|nr:unnamed protein product [Prunus armeniaca]CAB4294891.1 unnamed protein product [Prunus armeniaca]
MALSPLPPTATIFTGLRSTTTTTTSLPKHLHRPKTSTRRSWGSSSGTPPSLYPSGWRFSSSSCSMTRRRIW